jgi:hypothetical protein
MIKRLSTLVLTVAWSDIQRISTTRNQDRMIILIASTKVMMLHATDDSLIQLTNRPQEGDKLLFDLSVPPTVLFVEVVRRNNFA